MVSMLSFLQLDYSGPARLAVASRQRRLFRHLRATTTAPDSRKTPHTTRAYTAPKYGSSGSLLNLAKRPCRPQAAARAAASPTRSWANTSSRRNLAKSQGCTNRSSQSGRRSRARDNYQQEMCRPTIRRHVPRSDTLIGSLRL